MKMETREIATIAFIDSGSGEPAIAVVRQSDGCVALCLSIQRSGDLEVLLDRASAQKLAEAIKEGVERLAKTNG
jgi:hypothetical protein